MKKLFVFAAGALAALALVGTAPAAGCGRCLAEASRYRCRVSRPLRHRQY